jgi:hypothetical protein
MNHSIYNLFMYFLYNGGAYEKITLVSTLGAYMKERVLHFEKLNDQFLGLIVISH